MKLIKILIIAIISIFLGSCEKNYGYILDYENSKPMENVLVRDLNDLTNYVLTNEKGEFEFSECGDLIISKVSYKDDTLYKYGCRPNMRCFNGHIFYMEKIKKKDNNIRNNNK